MSDDDGPPPVRSAHQKPKRNTSRLPTASTPMRVDPRFDSMYGRADSKQFEANYKFLRDRQQEEQEARRHRIRCLKVVLRRHELEEAGEDLDEYDLSDTEREVFGPDHLNELARLKLTPPSRIYEELEYEQRQSQLHISRTKDKAATSRKAIVKKDLLKREVQAVKEGRKLKPFFPKRSEIKRAVLSDTYDRLEQSGGKGAVDRYLVKKVKRTR